MSSSKKELKKAIGRGDEESGSSEIPALSKVLKETDMRLYARLDESPASTFERAKRHCFGFDQVPQTEETRKFDADACSQKPGDTDYLKYRARKERLKEEAGYDHVRLSVEAGPQQRIPVSLYKISYNDTEGDRIKIGSGFASFDVKRRVDIEMDQLVESGQACERPQSERGLNESGESLIRGKFGSVREFKDNMSHWTDLHAHQRSRNPSGSGTEAGLGFTRLPMDKTTINPTSDMIRTIFGTDPPSYIGDNTNLPKFTLRFGGGKTES